jgi:CheY-like chemotaxis protein
MRVDRTLTEADILSGRRVLVVEDHYLIADEMRRMVEALGGDVVGPAGHLLAAMECIKGQAVDLALLDINLGADDVYLLARELSARRIPFIFASGYERGAVHEEFRGAAHVEKPVSRSALAECVRRMNIGGDE